MKEFDDKYLTYPADVRRAFESYCADMSAANARACDEACAAAGVDKDEFLLCANLRTRPANRDETTKLILTIHSDVTQAVDQCYKRYSANEMIKLLAKIKRDVDALTKSEVFKL